MADPIKIVVNASNPEKIVVNQGPITIQGGSNYTLPAATNTTLGGIIVGDNLTVTANGVLSGVNSYTLPAATNSTLGGVIVGNGVSVDNGAISVSTAYLNNSTANSTYSLTDTSTDSRLTWQKSGSPNATNSIRNEWLDNTGRYGTIQWILKPNTGPYAWLWGGIDINYNSTTPTQGSVNVGVNYSDSFSAGNAFGRGIKITPTDLTLTENRLGSATLPSKVWTANSILTQGYADSRYLLTSNFTYANLTGTPTFATVATSGSYNDLSNLPALFDGSYTSLTNVPATFAPSAHNHTISQITDFPSLATVATSGLYSDLTGTPDLTGYLTTATAASTYQPIGSYATTGENTFSGTQSLAGNFIDKPTLRSSRDAKATPPISAGTLTLDLSTSNFFGVSLNAAITTLSITNVPTSVVASFVLEFTADGTARAVAWPASFRFPSGTTPTLTTTSGKKDVFVVYTSDDGTTFDIVIAGQNL